MHDKKLGFIGCFRKTITNNIFLYKIWFYGVRRYKGDYVRLPSVEDDFYFDGYPRSGNTFFVGLLKRVFPHRGFASHLHVVASIKIALNLGCPVFTIIRDPKDAVVSNLFRKITENKRESLSRKLIEELLIFYYNYYLFVKEHVDDIHVLNFDSCINNELLTMQKIAKATGFEVKPDNFLNEIIDNFKGTMEKKEAGKDLQTSSLPNIHRVRFKQKYLNKVVNSPSYGMAEKLYSELIKYDLVIPK